MLFAVSMFAQTAPPPPGTPTVVAVISPQGQSVIKQVTGYTPKLATLGRVDICNLDPVNDHNQSVSGALSQIIAQTNVPLYSSDVVTAVMAELQQKDKFTRAQKIITAGGNTTLLIAALFKSISPTALVAMQAAPAIAAAILPAVGDPRDLLAMSMKILQDNTSLTLGKAGSGNDCHDGLVIAIASNLTIKTLTIQTSTTPPTTTH